jgi:hypothetical protein
MSATRQKKKKETITPAADPLVDVLTAEAGTAAVKRIM